MTTPFAPASAVGADDGGEFVALYLFDAAGTLLEAKIDAFGPRATMDQEKAHRIYQQRLQELGDVSYQRIAIAPFVTERFGRTFGLVLREPEDEDEVLSVELQPRNHVAFFEPWDNGEYDT